MTTLEGQGLLRLGTRGSPLAMAQSAAMARALEARHPSLRVELVEIRTSGDRIKDVPLGPHLGQAFFTREIQDALLQGRVDLAVAMREPVSSKPVIDVIERICTAVRGTGTAVGMFMPAIEELPGWKDHGASLFLLESDQGFLLSGARRLADSIRD